MAKVVVVNLWETENRVEEIINSNCKEIPYEGTQVDKRAIKGEIMDLIQELLNGKQ